MQAFKKKLDSEFIDPLKKVRLSKVNLEKE
jgi:hypothetical protein